MTRARTPEEADLLAASLEELGAVGLPVFVADSGSGEGFRQAIGNIPGVNLTVAGSSLAGQVKEAVRRAAAAGTELVVYTEPDKRGFFREHLLTFAGRAAEDAAAVTVAARDSASLAGFPQGQRQIESLFRELASVFLGPMPDLLYGPLAIRMPEMAPYVEAVSDDLGWGWRPYVIARAIRKGRRVGFYEGFFACPEEQRSEDDDASRMYRLQQFLDNGRGLQKGLAEGA